jgi:protein TonB
MSILAMSLCAFGWTNYNISERMVQSDMLDNIEDEMIPVNIPKPPPPPPPPQQTTVIEIVEDEEEIEEELEIIDLDLDEETEIEIIEEVIEEEDEEQIFSIVEKMPTYPGCEGMRGDELKQCTELKVITFVQTNITYPSIAQDAGIQGTVFVYYEVNREGKIQNVEVVRGVHSSLDKEARKAVEKLPKHSPGEQRGKPVTVRYTIPVRFVIK